MPIKISPNVTVTTKGRIAEIAGPLGNMVLRLPEKVKVVIKDDAILVETDSADSNYQGLVRMLLANAVKGVAEGWSKVVQLSGTGYRAAVAGEELQLALGFSHPVVIKAPPGIGFSVAENNITVKGVDKFLVGETAAKIRGMRPADPYKGKGFRYQGELIVRKAGKAAKAGVTGGK